ncbi:hypothetical protein [Streptosporangium pseudovulgare]|uniref:FtsK domain-containing protein n=1 Tax=Streptosporangium pseudovulgare TaxID=35765 RepID=A0ABQ2R6R0_9ACTN|nr:hypothetical protein [Streptosporangium pseudovulgare]GGQ11333.1 hypothetical protein GCM10010140_46860 [Streptosporangium pseudovulgare]
MSADAVEITLRGSERASQPVSPAKTIKTTPEADKASAGPISDEKAVPAGGSGSTGRASTERPLSPGDAGALRYAVSILSHGAARTPLHVWERAWDWLKVAHLREGGTHRGPVAERHAATYTALQQSRARRAGAVAKVAAWPWTTRAKVGKMPVAVVTWGVSAGEGVYAAQPANPLLDAVLGGFNGLVVDAAAAVVHLASPAALPAAGLAGLAAVGGSIRREHDRRRALLAVRDGADIGVREDGELLAAVPIADCSTPNAAMEAVRRALAIERVNVRPLSATATPWGWEVVVQMRKGQPGDITRVAADLETLLDVREAGVLVTPHRDRRARVTLRVVESDPWADMPEVPDYAGQGWTVRDPIWLGQRLDGAQIRTPFASKHSLILAASGGGKSVLLRLIADGLGAAADVHLWDLDPSGVGQAPQAAVMGRVALDPVDCETALTDAVAIAVARTRLLRKLGMGDSWQASPERPALAVIVDEYPRLTPAGREAAVSLLRIGRKAAVFLIFASQDAKKDTLGDSIAGQVAFRAAGPGLQDWQADLLFGAGARARGWDPGRYQPATSADSPNDAGTFYVAGAGEDMALPMRVGYMPGAVAQTRAERYAVLGRCPLLDAETLTAAGLDAASVYVRTDDGDAAAPVPLVPVEPEPVPAEALALLEAIADDVQAWPGEWVPAAELATMAASRMGWEPGRVAEMRTAGLLDAAGIPSRRRSTGVVRPRAALLTAVGRDLTASP